MPEANLPQNVYSAPRLLNLGCGSRIAPGWINVDFYSSADVRYHDLRTPLPFADSLFDLVYHSHVLEHFNRPGAVAFLSECRRVLKPGGILRLAVPDLEGIARAYLKSLDERREHKSEGVANHQWMIIELIDQMVRTRPGGEMGDYLRSPSLPNEGFVIERLGTEARKIINASRSERSPAPTRPSIPMPSRIKRQLGRAWRGFQSGKVKPLVRRSLQRAPSASQCVAMFREQGEIHQWMYDELSLTDLLIQTGFHNPVKTDAVTSFYDGWSRFGLDTEPDGSVYKPDSLFMEATRPVL